jgi:hypothetical protein
MSRLSSAARLRRAAAGLAFAFLLGSAAAAPLDDMRREVEEGRLDLAYQTAKQNPQLIGNVHFDFLYGLAAIGTGHVPEGILALERHLAAVPANDRARLELARGYFLIGEYARARSEFEFVLRYNPPAAVRENIERYLRAMELRETTLTRSASRAYAEVGIGHDTNVNGGTFRDQLQFQFGSVSLVGTPSQGASDNFYVAAAGVASTMRVSARMSVSASLDLDTKQNFQLHEYDLSNLGASAGFTVVNPMGVARGTLALGRMFVGGNPYRDSYVLGAELNQQPNAELSTSLFLQMTEFRYDGADAVRDARGFTVGAMATRNLGSLPGAPAVGARLSWLQEDNLRFRPDLSRNVPLLRLFASASPADSWRIAAGLTGYYQHYGGTDVAFGTVREDTTTSFDLSATYAIGPDWSVRGEFVATSNRSNQDLYDSTRRIFGVRMRYQF